MGSHKLLFFVVILVACLTNFATDIYTPAIPNIAVSLNTSIHIVQWSMALYMLGVAASQLIYGPLSDGIGRKPPLIFGLVIMLMGSIICMLAPNINILILGRLIQGCGAGSCAALWRSVFRDVFSGEELAKYGSYFSTLIMFVLPAAPIVGGYLTHYIGFRANFVFISLYTIIALGAIIYGFKETSIHHHKAKFRLAYILNTYAKLLTNPIFIGTTLASFLSYGALFAWITTGPALLIQQLKLTPVSFGWVSFLTAGLAYGLAGQINGRLVSHCGMVKMMRIGWSNMIIAILLLLIGTLLVGTNLYVIILSIILFYFGSTFIWSNANAIVFTPFAEIAGFVGALYSFSQICGGAVCAAIMTHLSYTCPIPLGILMLGASILAWLSFELITIPHFK